LKKWPTKILSLGSGKPEFLLDRKRSFPYKQLEVSKSVQPVRRDFPIAENLKED
jgi:hypothetical protein